MADLRSHCDCGRRVRVLWSGPPAGDSRPVLLVCGWHPQPRCGLRVQIPASAVESVPPAPFPPIDMGGLERYIEAQCRADNDRLERQALALLVACVPLDEIVIVEQQTDGYGPTDRTIMTREQLDNYIADGPRSSKEKRP